LAEALARAGIANPTIARADEAVRAGEAQLLQACALLLPTANGGANVRFHQGALISAGGFIRDVNIQSVYVGGGAGAKAAETVPIPGLRVYSHLGDAIFAPQAAQQVVVSREFDAVTVRNRTLLEVGTAYLALVRAQGERNSLLRTDEDLSEVVRLTVNQAKAGQGKDSDAQRARTEGLLLKAQIQQSDENVAVAAAELARLLDMDPSAPLRPADAVPPLIELVDPATPLPELLQAAVTRHPELAARNAEVAAAMVHLRQERVRPWLPVLSAGASLGNFGGTGSLSPDRSWFASGRLDFDVSATWTVQNLAVGNRALQREARAVVGEAAAERNRIGDLIREEVTEAYGLVLSRRQEIDLARQRIDTASKAFKEDMLRAKNLEGRPIELLQSVALLRDARLALVSAMAEYSQAQLRLWVGLGNTPRD
jgi:outer membrane protein TolC